MGELTRANSRLIVIIIRFISAIMFIGGARFTPTTLSGMPVKVSGIITYNFVLQ